MSTTDDYCTPAWLARMLPVVDLDPASNPRSHIRATRSVCLPDNGLDEAHWLGVRSVWINPPYSKVMPWVERAVAAATLGAEVAMLLKLDPTTEWWAAMFGETHATQVLLCRERIAFELEGKKNSANFPNALVVLSPRQRAAGAFARTATRLRLREAVW